MEREIKTNGIQELTVGEVEQVSGGLWPIIIIIAGEIVRELIEQENGVGDDGEN